MNLRKIAFVLEWVGAGIIILGVVLMALNYSQVIEFPFRHDGFMMIVIGIALMCFVPKKHLAFKEIQKTRGDDYLAGRRSVVMNFILAVILIIVGTMRILA
ncbi:hypothetical protein [Treponema zioleckii]|uniref:hypothetical protein n=1 Tax=Treponema zioleckii TaxID=331680 RepID=UPI00168A9008|nr:hypothetical protein [Treponema zioleckii]